MDAKIGEIVNYCFNNFSSQVISVVLFVVCYIILLWLLRVWQIRGLYLYSVLAIILANIHVLKNAIFAGVSEPISLGTIIFATTFTASDIITEFYGVEEAKKCLKICFAAQIIIMLLMLIAICFPSIGNVTGHDINGKIINPVQNAMYILFVPSLRITIASLISYYFSQLIDIHVFQYISKLTNKKMVWLRFNLASFISNLCDNIIFSTLAWVVLGPEVISFKTLIFTYILGTYLSRVAVSLFSTPVMYMAKYLSLKN